MEHLKGATLGWAPALPAKIKLGGKGLPQTFTLTYYERACFITLASDQALILELVFFVAGLSKIECFSIASFFRLI